jgi:RNA polymerase sigma factor (sigma-70 family)
MAGLGTGRSMSSMPAWVLTPHMQRNHHRLVEWFRELRSPLRRFLTFRRGVAPVDLDDVAQEVFLRLLRYDRAELVSDPRAYLFRIAANVASEWSMRARNRLPHDAAWLDDLVADDRPDDQVERELENRQLGAALAQLPARAREVLRLHFAEGMRHEEIAASLHVTARIVKRDLINAYSTLRDSFAAETASSRTLTASLREGPENP